MSSDHDFNKIFGIGLSRTGTTSLGVALLYLGIRTAHYVTDDQTYRQARALLDTPVFVDFEKLDKQYPGSRFIYTQRDPDAWVDSFRDKLLDGPMNQRQDTRNPHPPHAFTRMNQRVYRELFGRIDGLTDAVLRDGFLRHRDRVMQYFSGRSDDLLVITIDEDDDESTWNRLCEFVGLEIPGSFPRFANRSAMLWAEIVHPCKVNTTP